MQPTNDQEKGLLEDGYAIMEEIKTCFQGAISGEDNVMSVARRNLDKILSVSHFSSCLLVSGT